MAKMLLVNPSPRRAKRRASPAQIANRARFAAAARRRSNPVAAKRRRRRNPVPPLPVMRATRAARRSTGLNAVSRHRRRRNPINLRGLSTSSYITMLKDGFVSGAGAVAVDLAYGQISSYLPASMQRTATPGVGDAVKALVTVVLGSLLKGPTRGLSVTAARGALTVQAHGLIANLLPSAMTLGYSNPAMVTNVSNRIGPNRLNGRNGRVGQYTDPGVSNLLSRFTAPGSTSPLLSEIGRAHV